MLDKELRELGPPEIYDNTILSNMTKCPRNLYWFLRGLDYKISPTYFTWGRALGVGLNTWHVTQGKEEPKMRLARAIVAAQEEWEKDNPVEIGDNTWDNLENCLKLYVEVYGVEEPWTMLYDTGELGFALPIPGTSISYGGALDAPIVWNPYGILVREDKSTGGYITDAYLDQWNHASQVTGYLWGLHQVTGEEPFGAYMNIVSKRPRKESQDRFYRLLVKRSEWELAQFMRDTVLLIDDIRREYDRWLWPKLGERDPINCAGGMGRSACLYRRLCKTEMEPWELEETYDFDQEFLWREKKWEPWKRKGENE